MRKRTGSMPGSGFNCYRERIAAAKWKQRMRPVTESGYCRGLAQEDRLLHNGRNPIFCGGDYGTRGRRWDNPPVMQQAQSQKDKAREAWDGCV